MREKPKMSEQRPEKKPDLLNMDGNDVTRAVMYWMTTCLRVILKDKVQDEAVRGDEENLLWQSALIAISWRKQRREFIDLIMSEKVGSHSLPNRTPITDKKYVADNGCWKATGPGYSVSYNYQGERPNGSTGGKDDYLVASCLEDLRTSESFLEKVVFLKDGNVTETLAEL
ncbi:hypothetical protein PROFUN_16337 [Planoprotostelium fungivorum]|uniref:Uncharacterized protein n=1 Tax=Planoprotostelium fungivorum TaxID=1890364 RepID=A0A2P6MR80_9EUKA|nr:hypothetical protein PROFUN_16337 [Planoprotostelium fungivorum]